MSDVVWWFVCLLLGHVRTEWAPVTWVYYTVSGAPPEYNLDSTAQEEARFCLRCHSGYQERWAR